MSLKSASCTLVMTRVCKEGVDTDSKVTAQAVLAGRNHRIQPSNVTQDKQIPLKTMNRKDTKLIQYLGQCEFNFKIK